MENETILTAEQARELAKTGREKMINKILDNIKFNAKSGGNLLEYWTDIKGRENDFSHEFKALKELGYEVKLEFSGANNEYKFLITW